MQLFWPQTSDPSVLEILGSIFSFGIVAWACYVEFFTVPLIGDGWMMPFKKFSFLTTWTNLLWFIVRGLCLVEVFCRLLNISSLVSLGWISFFIEPFVGACGFYLTVAYYGLIHFNKDLWNNFNKLVKDGVIPYSLDEHLFKMHLIHLPHIFLSWLAILTRNPALLRRHLPSEMQLVTICTGWVALYMAQVLYSYRVCGLWPYPFYAGFKRWYHHVGFNTIMATIYLTIAFGYRWGVLEWTSSLVVTIA